MSSELLNLILAITSIITTITLMVTLGIVARQTTHTAKQTKLNTIINYYQHLKDINIVLLEHTEKAPGVVWDTREDTMITIMLITLGLSFKLYRQGLIGPPWWKGDREMALRLLNKEQVRCYWEQNKHVYDLEFVEFIDGLCQELDREKQNSSMVSQTPTTSV